MLEPNERFNDEVSYRRGMWGSIGVLAVLNVLRAVYEWSNSWCRRAMFDWLICDWVRDLTVPMLGHNWWAPCAPYRFMGAPLLYWSSRWPSKLVLIMSSGSKKKEPRYACLSEAKASHSQRMWAEVSSCASHLLHSGLSDSSIRWRCLLRVLCPVRRPVTTLDCFLLKDRNVAVAPRQGPKINSEACLWVSPRPCHHIQCWLTVQRLIIHFISRL